MKLKHLFAAAVAAFLVAGPAVAQWSPPPPPPFVVNPKLSPPPGTPSALQQTPRQARQQARAERRAARAERHTNRHARAAACQRQADAEGLAGRERRRFVRRCRHH